MRRRFAPLLLMFAVFATNAYAQSLQFNASVRARSEQWNWFGSESGGNYNYNALLARLSVKQQRGSFSWLGEVAAPLVIGLPADAVAGAPRGQLGLGAAYWTSNDSATSATGIFIKQAFVRYAKKGHAIKAGRFEFIDGLESVAQENTIATLQRDRIAHRLLGNFGFSHAQRSFDGVQYMYDAPRVNFALEAMRPTQGVFNVNGWPELDINVAYAAVSSRAGKTASSQWRVFGLYYDDARANPVPVKTDNRPAAVRTADTKAVEIMTTGAHFIHTMPLGDYRADVVAWGALQTGSWGLQKHRANAFAVETGVQAKTGIQPWLRIGYARSSGDKNNTDDRHGTFFQVLPTPRAYARFPFYNAMNLDDRFASLSFTTGTRASFRFEAHRLALSNKNDGWYSGGGAFDDQSFGFSMRPSNGQGDLATLLDGSAQLKLAKTLSATAYAAWARGGDVIGRVYSDESNGVFGYLELEWRR